MKKLIAEKTFRPLTGVRINARLHKASKENGQTIDLEPAPEEFYTFSVDGSIGRDQFGQCQDSISPLLVEHGVFLENEEVARIMQFWYRWHLNDMNAGTRDQQRFDCHQDYDANCQELRKLGMYEDRGNKYGHAWLVELIPDEIVEEMKNLLKYI